MKEVDRCIEFLEKNDYIKMYSDDSKEEYQTLYWDNGNISSIDLFEDEIVFVDGSGDWLHLPCNYYALIGALLHFSQISIGYKR